MKTRILLIVMLGLVGLSGRGQVTFQKTYGGGTQENFGSSVHQTTDGGYIFVGSTNNYGAGQTDVYLIKTDSLGDTLWNRTYYGGNSCMGVDVKQTTDGGYIIVGTNDDVYLIKTDSIGDTLWSKTFGGVNSAQGNSVQQTTDGGYIIVGYTHSFPTTGSSIYLIKTNAVGDTLVTKSYHTSNYDEGLSIQQTNDGGFIIVGKTGFSPHVYLIKINSIFDTAWTKIYGGSSWDYANSVKQTSDGGFIIVGNTLSFGAGGGDVYLIKTDALGDTLFTKTFGGNNNDEGESVQQTKDRGYIIVGWTTSFGAGQSDVYLIKTDSLGDTLWTRTYGGTEQDYGYSVQQTVDGGYVVVGMTKSFRAGSQGDIYLLKTDSLGNGGGCNQYNTQTIVGSTNTIVSRPHTIVSHGAIVTSPQTIVGSGGKDSTLCRTQTDINEITPTPSLLLSPNPFTTQTMLTLQGSYHNPSLFIYNLLGQEVKSIPVGTNKQITIPRNQLPAGMYFYKLIEENKEVIGIGKLLVE